MPRPAVGSAGWGAAAERQTQVETADAAGLVTDAPAQGVAIEAHLDRGRGPVVPAEGATGYPRSGGGYRGRRGRAIGAPDVPGRR